MKANLAAAPSRLDRNYAEFVELVSLARKHHEQGRDEVAAVVAQAAAQHAWLNPNGLFASNDLENLVAELGAGLPGVTGRSVRGSAPRTVLHVITQAYQTGGSTQFVACWKDEDLGRRHRVCLTQQGVTVLPEKILTRFGGHGDLVRLDSVRSGLLDRAQALRRLAAECDVVLLNVHPHDVVPSLAFAEQDGLPPIIYVNHADHVFWLGTRVTQTLLNMRLSGAQLAADRRGIEPPRSNLTCRPLRPAGRTISRGDAKRELGLNPAEVLVVTAADGSKYRSVGDRSLLDMILPVFAANNDLVLRAAGPTALGEWADAEVSTGGRVRALGPLPDVNLLHQAADIYLDSYPFSSLTSMIEAGSYGTPAVTFRGHPDSCAVLGADTYGLDEYMVRPTTAAELRSALQDLTTRTARREKLGTDFQRVIVQSHTGAGWRTGAAELFHFASAAQEGPEPRDISRQTGDLDQLVDLVMSQTRFSRGVDGVMLDQLNLLPMKMRLPAAARLTGRGFRPGARQLLSARNAVWLSNVIRRVRPRRSA